MGNVDVGLDLDVHFILSIYRLTSCELFTSKLEK